MASYYSDPNLQAALLAQAAYEADRQKEGGDQGGGFIDALGKAALVAGAGVAAGLGAKRLLANRAARTATQNVSVEDLGSTARKAEETVRRAAGRQQTAPPPSQRPPAPSQPPTARPTPGGMVERLGTMEENARVARAERMPGIVQTDLSNISPERARATLGIQKVSVEDLGNPPAATGGQGLLGQFSPYGQLQEGVDDVVSEIKALPPTRPSGTDFLANQLGGRGYIEQTVLNRAAEQAAGDLIDEVSAFSNKGARSEIARQAASIQSQERKNLWNLVSEIQNETLVNQQQTTRAFNVDQAINALESGEDQMTGRTMSALQRNEDIDIGTVDRLQDTYEAPLRTQTQPTEALANRQDASVNAVADMMPDGRPLDQAEGIDLRTGQRFSLNTPRQTRTGLGPGQSVEMTSQPVSTTGFVKDFIAKQRGNIASQLEQEGGAATTGRVEKELASRLGPKSYEYGSEFTKTKQAMEVGLEDPRYLQAASLSQMPNTRMVSGTEFDVNIKDVMQDDPELAFRKPFISEQTAINSEQDFINKQNEVKNWLGGVRLEVTPRINALAKQQAALGEQQNMLLYSLNQKPDRELGQQLRNVANQMQNNESELNFLNNRLAGATNTANEQLEELSKWTPSTLVDWSGEGTVVRPKRTAPDTMSFEAEGGELSNIERGARMAQPGPNDLEIVPGGLLSGGRAKSVSNINAFDPETGEPLKMQAASRTSIRGENSGESYSDILSSEDMYGVQRAAMGASSTSPEAAISPSNSPSAWRLPAGSRKQGKQTVNVVVAGGRKYENYPELSQKLDQTISQLNIPEGMSVKIVSGGARGADTLAERYAQERGLGLQVFPANWNEQGLSAGTLRNTQMAKEGDVLVAFPGGSGTENMIRQMTQDFGKPAYRASDMVTQTPTPQKQESFDVARQLRQLQLTGKPGEAQSFLDKMMKQRGVSVAGGTFSTLR